MAHPKGVLIERLQKEGRQPRFETRRSGPDHEPVFDAEAYDGDALLGSGSGGSKRVAERLAAEAALEVLEERASGSRRARGKGGARRGGKAQSRPGRKPAAEADDAQEEQVEPRPAEVDVPAAVAGAAAGAPATDASFDGPWPLFDSVLATSLRIAHERVAVGLASDEAREAIERFALTLYKNVLQDLGEVVEEEVEEEVEG